MTARQSAPGALLVSILLAVPAAAAEAGPDEVMRQNVDAAFAVLKDKSLAGKEQRPNRIAALRRIADRVFDWPEMARSSLGVRWRSLNAQQRSQFVDVFKDVLAARYMDDIDRFQGSETIVVEGTVRQGEDTLVHTTLVTASRDRVPIDYLMRLEEAQWKVVDLSIVNHFRRTFAAALANMTIDQLIEKLRRQLPARP